MDGGRITARDLQQLLRYFSTYTYKAKETHPIAVDAMKKCLQLMSADYEYSVIENSTGDLSNRYPSHLVVLEGEKRQNSDAPCTIYEGTLETAKLKEVIAKARFARCRSRFPVPVILYKGKHICRSATLSGGPELYGRSGFNFLFSTSNNQPSAAPPVQQQTTIVENDEEVDEEDEVDAMRTGEWQLFDKVRNQDIKLLKLLNIGTIIDFMVEKKKIKFGVYVTSSEKVDKENRYNDFRIVALPYPGCEFFKEFRENNHSGDGLVYDWSHPQVDTGLGIPEDSSLSQLKIDWSQYQDWDLTELTKNYMRLILRYVVEAKSGLLVHCISGWDRTPLFISLLRLSLWADGLAHQSLSAAEVLYLSLAYDWMLFGHHLADRLSRGEEILFFCFHFLTQLGDSEFSMHLRIRKSSPLITASGRNESESSSSFADFEEIEAENLLYPQESSIPSSLSSTRSQEQPVFYSNLPKFMEQSQNCNMNSVSDLWASAVMQQSVECRSGPDTSSVSPDRSSPLFPDSQSSPMAVPGGRFRNRHDSNGSVAGSWQIISDQGSLRGWTSCGTADSVVFSKNSSSLYCPEDLTHSTITVIEDENSCLSNCSLGEVPQSREEKLKAVQSLFFNVYHSTSPLPSEGLGLGSFLGNFAEKVGIFPTAHS